MRNALLTLLAILVAAGVYAYAGLSKGGDTSIGVHGWIATFLGVVFSLVCGVGLMSLVFYSSRHGYDEPPSDNHGTRDQWPSSRVRSALTPDHRRSQEAAHH
jgi:hypothetical protein